MGGLTDHAFGYGSLARDLLAGVAAGTAVVQRSYLEHVEDGFRRLGADEHADFLATSDLDGLPQLDLERVDVPAERPAR